MVALPHDESCQQLGTELIVFSDRHLDTTDTHHGQLPYHPGGFRLRLYRIHHGPFHSICIGRSVPYIRKSRSHKHLGPGAEGGRAPHRSQAQLDFQRREGEAPGRRTLFKYEWKGQHVSEDHTCKDENVDNVEGKQAAFDRMGSASTNVRRLSQDHFSLIR